MSNTTPLGELSVRKSNEMVSAKYKSTLLENQVMTIALTRIEENARDVNAPLTATLYPGELKRLIGDPAHIYRTLKTVAKTMVGHTMFMEDRKGNFHAYAIVTDAEYSNGTFTVKFNETLRAHILGLEKNYTTYELSVLTNFRSNSAFRLYELLKKEIYKSRKDVNGGRVDVEYNISELRFMIGLANADDPGVKNAMARMGDDVDWDELYDLLDKKDKKYENWKDMKRWVIVPAQKELLEKSNIRFDFDTYRQKRKINRIVFHVYPNVPVNEERLNQRKEFLEKNREKSRQMEFPRDLEKYRPLYDEFVGHNGLSEEDIGLLLEKADGDAASVRSAILQADKQESVNNYMGWLIRCIERGGYEDVPVVHGSRDRGEVASVMAKEVHAPEVAERVWERLKKKDDFSSFLHTLSMSGMTMDALEEAYTPEERNQMYFAWKKNDPIPF